MILKYLAHLFWPCTCPVCGAAAEDLCSACSSELLDPEGPVCLLCGGPVPCGIHGSLPAYSGSSHSGMTRELVLLIKYGGRARLAREMGRALGRSLEPPDAGSVLVPVPLHLSSPRKYNQARWIAMGLGDVWNLPVRDGLFWTVDCEPRTSMGGQERMDLPRDAMGWRGGGLYGVSCVVVDDVRTTGTTLERSGRALFKAGASQVSFVTWSRSAKIKRKGRWNNGTEALSALR